MSLFSPKRSIQNSPQLLNALIQGVLEEVAYRLSCGEYCSMAMLSSIQDERSQQLEQNRCVLQTLHETLHQAAMQAAVCSEAERRTFTTFLDDMHSTIAKMELDCEALMHDTTVSLQSIA